MSWMRLCIGGAIILSLIGSATAVWSSLHPDPASAAAASRLGRRAVGFAAPGLTIEPYVRPELAARMATLRPTILAAAARHNRPNLSGMNDVEFAEVITLLLYNEHNGWLEDDVEPLRVLTPFYEAAQRRANAIGVGGNFSVWPANLRPSVALEILRRQLPIPDPPGVISVPVHVAGSLIDPDRFADEQALFVAINAELCRDEMAIEYLAANLERGLYRAQYERVPVSWRTLAAWHNQGVVAPEQIRANPVARDYVRRASAYLPLAHQFVTRPEAPVRPGPADGRMARLEWK